MKEVTYKILSRNLSVVESLDKKNWKKSKKTFPEAIHIAKLFKAHKNFGCLKDSKSPRFLKGQYQNGPKGARINILPDGKRLTRAYSLFSPNLQIHDEKSNNHWDVIYQNPNGAYSYLYTLDKQMLSRKKKYKKVEEFNKILPKLKRNLGKNLNDSLSIAIIILLKTKMRVGNDIYYKKSGHKGLTTLKKKNISVLKNKVTFDYLAKDGVPQKKKSKLSKNQILALKKILLNKKNSNFIFCDSKGKPLKDTEFEKAFEKYCGKKFYPHIIRSHYATKEVEKFVSRYKKPSKEQIKKLYLKIAEELGHMKFSKKKNDWENSYQVTLNYYVRPDLIEKLEKRAI